MAAPPALPGAAAAGPRAKIFVCDLPDGVPEEDLRYLFGLYGTVVSVSEADEAPEKSLIVEYATAEAASEAQGHLNHGMIRGKIIRVMLVSTLELIRKTMVSGRRFIIENLDTDIDSHGFFNICCLFGEVCDCKLQLRNSGYTKGYGFVHYAEEADAARARKALSQMQVGEKTVSMRPFAWDDAPLFTGTLYARAVYNPYLQARSNPLDFM